MSDLAKIKSYIDEHGDTAGAAVIAGLQLAGSLTAREREKRPQEILTGIPDADLALAQAAGVGAIAGQEGVDVEEIIKVAGLFLSLGMTFI